MTDEYDAEAERILRAYGMDVHQDGSEVKRR